MALNVGMLATYDQTKEVLTEKFGAGSVCIVRLCAEDETCHPPYFVDCRCEGTWRAAFCVHFTDGRMGRAEQFTNFTASAVAGFFASFFSLPFDFVKTRMQKMTPLPDGTMPYKSSIDCAIKVCLLRSACICNLVGNQGYL